jgi:hypothetical protein
VQASVNIVIPTKSNSQGLIALLNDLSGDSCIDKICVVADGHEAFDALPPLASNTMSLLVPEGTGIQHMWNRGMDSVGRDKHIFFLNDDVRLHMSCATVLAESLDQNSDIGLICPNYSSQDMPTDRSVVDTCRSRYDGTGGMAGFAMMLRNNLAAAWVFDENLKWWYGDDDLVMWVTQTQRLQAVISHQARCEHADSVTIRTNPPRNFGRIVEEDGIYFVSKWNGTQ